MYLISKLGVQQYSQCLFKFKIKLRFNDKFLGVFTGLLSFYLHENHPKVNRDDDYKLLPLVRWKFSKANVDRNENVKDELEDENLKELIKQFNNTK